VAQENALKSSGIPYTIVRATQFFEFVGSLADSATAGQPVRLPNVLMQPIAAEDISAGVARVALQPPKNGYINVAGPDRLTQDELAREFLKARNDPRQVIADPSRGYFGGQIPENALVPDRPDVLGAMHFSDWLAHSQQAALQSH